MQELVIARTALNMMGFQAEIADAVKEMLVRTRWSSAGTARATRARAGCACINPRATELDNPPATISGKSLPLCQARCDRLNGLSPRARAA